jgi:hypothetical protein
MTVHDESSLDAELDLLRATPAPRAQLRHDVLAAVAREPRRISLLDALVGLWRELGGVRLAGPAFAMALAAGVGLSWLADDSAVGVGDESSDDLVALAQFDDAYEGLEP